MEENAAAARHLSDLRDGLDGPDFIISAHDRDQDRVGRKSGLDVLRIHLSRLAHRHTRDPVALFLQGVARL